MRLARLSLHRSAPRAHPLEVMHLRLLAGVAGAVVVSVLVLWAVQLFVRAETDRLRRPLEEAPPVPVLRRDALEGFADRIRSAPPPPAASPTPAGSPSRGGREPRGSPPPTDILSPARVPLEPSP